MGISAENGAWIKLTNLLSHPEFHQKNFEFFIIKILLENDYPLDF